MSNIDKRALREAAEKATPGRIGDRVDGSIKYTCRGTDGTLVLSTDNHDDYGFVGDNSLGDELFFRLCDPVTVLALLDELEAAEKLIAELETREVILPQRMDPEGYHIDEAYMVAAEDGEYLDRDEVIEAMRTAGIRINGEG
ncbi:ead/Ea22-like family protein [Enterobacter hormaechei]|uniref:ead/Ea22-like family protein n=2 Tax=Enterobacter hormaechei TaxID=158836 RepID=UPI00079ABE60|nr:ead/Ea22-like family protein [Enterobacter hormaechei]MBJ6434785.1 ead/Ea22-like family protein [Enterobacter cloacae]EKA2120746.1 ead/Ea22-like family protein [Enterobacter hormaechei]EKU5350651.1 ead/Ea22-like family protein [Enterobacter hormaechei]ELD3404160.1 ead/Ea22-like family protein [Enterobacter hormaechei]ELN5477518.1 ead/Ea22-like family protein [Enterobacter hormaechei]